MNICFAWNRYGWLEIAERLLSNRNVRIINLQNNQGKTPLHYACHEGHEQIAQLLLIEGATSERSDNDIFLFLVATFARYLVFHKQCLSHCFS